MGRRRKYGNLRRITRRVGTCFSDSVQLIDGLAKNARGNELRSNRDPINDRQTNVGTQQQSDGNNQQRLNQDGRNEEDQRRSNQRRSNQRRLNQRRLNRERKKERLKENVKDILKTGGLSKWNNVLIDCTKIDYFRRSVSHYQTNE